MRTQISKRRSENRIMAIVNASTNPKIAKIVAVKNRQLCLCAIIDPAIARQGQCQREGCPGVEQRVREVI